MSTEPLDGRRHQAADVCRREELLGRKEPGKTRGRTIYSLTEKRLQSLREYVETPVSSRR